MLGWVASEAGREFEEGGVVKLQSLPSPRSTINYSLERILKTSIQYIEEIYKPGNPYLTLKTPLTFPLFTKETT